MVPLTQLQFALPADKVPTQEIARDIIAAFLTKEWPDQDPATITVTYSTSFTNPSCIVERPAPNTARPATEPLKLFIKFHRTSLSDFEAFRHLVPSKEEEAQLTYKYGLTGLGPRVYGLFRTLDGTRGRIDEFLDSRHLQPEDVEDEAIRADVARSLATFHTLQTALPQKPVASYYEAIGKGLRKYHGLERLKMLSRDGGVPIDELVDYDIAGRCAVVVAALRSMSAKTGWCVHDIQSMNILVKNGPADDGSGRIALVDLEFAFSNYRALDIGGHFMQKMFKWFDSKSKIADCRPYLDAEERHFCDVYAARWRERTGDADDDGLRVYREARLGYMLAIAFDIHNMLCWMEQEDDKDPLNLAGLNKLFAEFKGRYEELGLGAAR
ncbi:choline/ethanolamine kinase [Cordyceps fumosorosea ARSEF 2679]|uniref:Choline/ethanolamine kinase n=1 Tax=Cordyceps fumosorosea (strain ARSEF 2679) TaxID=1081104 RepID=A0A167XBN0_CORFA|nr:choline/ethanolamine kinase [Cordyceps fumosorosea ARSEF 2679]OAA64771.1 choline/ethanolamine kinase [Cordyceps fumosorosea ARSEF 2679]